jgi:Glycosyl transferase family 2
MLVSFVVIAYNEAPAIAAALEAILGQEPAAEPVTTEIVVVNDGSQDGTLSVVEQVARRCSCLRVVDLQPNRGRGAARAAGVAQARGDCIAFVDADILVPPDWLRRCLQALDTVDAVGGVPVPDGDVAYVHRIFGLVPKPRPAAAAVTGCNGLFRRRVFDRVRYDPARRNGEDVELVAAMTAAGLRMRTLTDLLVEHREHKGYLASLRWLTESGSGATRQLLAHRVVRLPDVVAVGFWGVAAGAAVVQLAGGPAAWAIGALAGYVLSASVVLLLGRFRLGRTPLAAVGAVATQATLLVAYFAGRLTGLPRALRDRGRRRAAATEQAR